MTKSTITRERLEALANAEYCKSNPGAWLLGLKEVNELARMALAAMDSEPVEMPLDYLQGHKDGLEFASQLAEANHPETGDWLYDDPIELAKAIRKGPDMPPSQPAPVSLTKAQRDTLRDMDDEIVAALEEEEKSCRDGIRKCIASLRYHHKRAEAHSTGYKGSTLEDDTLKSISFLKRNIIAATLQAEHVTTANKLGNSPVIPDGYVMVPKVPSQAHLNSIAMRYRHDFYLLNDAQKDSALATARQMYEECSGQGFYTLPAAPQEVK